MDKIVNVIILLSAIFAVIIVGIYIFIFPNQYKAPAISRLTANEDGIKIELESVDGVEAYAILKYIDGKWEKIADVEDNVFIDTSVEYGNTYRYSLRCETSVSGQYISGYDKEGVSLIYLKSPELQGYKIKKNGISILWSGVDSAEGYRIFRKEQDGSWNKVGDVGVDITEYLDTTPQSGIQYIYTVRCLNNSRGWYTSGYDKEGISVKLIDTPQLSSVDVVSNGIELNWNLVDGAEGYRVFRKEGTDSWKKIEDVSSETSKYIDENAAYGVQYTYTIRCIDSDEKEYTSEYDNGLEIIQCEMPQIISFEVVDSGIQINWDGVENAEKYKIFKKTNAEDKWIGIATLDSSNKSYIDEDVVQGNEYYYAVRCINNDETAYTSWYIKNVYEY